MLFKDENLVEEREEAEEEEEREEKEEEGEKGAGKRKKSPRRQVVMMNGITSYNVQEVQVVRDGRSCRLP